MTTSFHLENYFDRSPDCLCIVGQDFIIRRTNPAFRDALGYTADELLGAPVFNIMHPDDQDRTEAALEKMRQHFILTDFENRYVTKAGETRWFSWTAIPVESEPVFFGLAKDITHQRKLDEDRNQLLTRMTKSVDDLKQLTWATSHDLRAPVNNLLAVFSMMDISRIQDPEVKKFVDMFKLATDNLRATLDDYVDMLSEKEAMNVSTEEVDLEEVLGMVMKSLSSLIDHTGTEISMDFAAFKTVEFNRIYMESIFLNLLTNSIKYAKPDVAPKISVSTQVVNGVRQLVFADGGQGFDMERVKDKVFGLRQKFNEQQDSKGIGLYLVHHHVTSMGGRIDLHSIPGDGATFTISFS